MATVEWTNNAVLQLVKEYEKHAVLWDRGHNLYHVTSAKNAAWISFAAALSSDLGDVRKKLKSVLASFRRERAKVKDEGFSTWFLYPHLSFLQGYVPGGSKRQEETSPEHYEQIELLESFSKESSDETNVSDDEETVSVKQELLQPLEVYVPNHSAIDERPHNSRRLTRKITKPSKRTMQQQFKHLRQFQSRQLKPRQPTEPSKQETYKAYVDTKVQELQRQMMKDTLRMKDDCDTFGEYIASILRKHDNKTQCLIKQAINNVLFEREMNKYESNLEVEMVTDMLDE